MILEQGDMWDVFGKTDLFLITTNPIVRKDGAVVMGRGIAKEASTRFPQLPYDFGTFLDGADPAYFRNGIIGEYDGQKIGCFMVKTHWAEPANLRVILVSASQWAVWAKEYSRVDLNFPGIGNGKLKREDVLPMIEHLPDNVHVWEYE
jgi:hypothetical protein